MAQQHRSAAVAHGGDDGFILQQCDLASRAAEALDAVNARQHDEERPGAGVAKQREIDGKLLALRARDPRMHARNDGEPLATRSLREFFARFRVRRGERGGDVEHR